MSAEELVVAGLLLSVVPLGVVEAVGYTRGGYLTAFWRLTLDDKLDRIAVTRGSWWIMGVSWLAIMVVTTSGVTGVASLLAGSGELVAAGVGASVFILAASGWMIGLTVQTAGIGVAAEQRRTTGSTPLWAEGLWQVAYLTETVWIVGTGLAYTALGVGILRGDVLPVWSGWAVIAIGIGIPVIAITTGEGFPHMALLAPLVLAVGLILH